MKLIAFCICMTFSLLVTAQDKHPIYDLTVPDIHGKAQTLEQYRGKVILIVNVASKCGFTKQYKGLQTLYEQYNLQGLVILAFPCNDFGKQEPGTSKDIQTFCSQTYGVTFPLFEKIRLKGKSISPLYQHLTKQTNDNGTVKWNFEKFLVDRRGNVQARYRSKVKPSDPSLTTHIKTLLSQAP